MNSDSPEKSWLDRGDGLPVFWDAFRNEAMEGLDGDAYGISGATEKTVLRWLARRLLLANGNPPRHNPAALGRACDRSGQG
jgi:hypothetical protein